MATRGPSSGTKVTEPSGTAGRAGAAGAAGAADAADAADAEDGLTHWQPATVREVRRLSASLVALRLEVAGRITHLPGQHYVVRLTAEDGYTASRSYSIASAPGDELVELCVERLPDGEVSGYLYDVVEPGDQLEVRGPILLPWDQIALWAITVGTNLAPYTPLVGSTVYKILVGGGAVSQSTLIRFYVGHVILFPLAAALLMAVHFWRIRKDGGAAGPPPPSRRELEARAERERAVISAGARQ